MRSPLPLGLALALLLAAPLAEAKGGGHGGSHSTSSHSSRSRASASHGSASTHRSSPHGAKRGSHGTTKRDPEQRAKFMQTHPCPSTGKTHGSCPGYVVDHIHALKHGGRDDPSNMQWQTREAAKAKDKWE